MPPLPLFSYSLVVLLRMQQSILEIGEELHPKKKWKDPQDDGFHTGKDGIWPVMPVLELIQLFFTD